MDLSIADKLAMFLVLLLSLSFHEAAHAWVAERMGDDTPRRMGRVTLNPLAHIDLLGTIIIPLGMLLLAPSFIVFGWGKPVMIDSRNFKKPVLGDCLSTLAGPFANLLLALLTALVFGIWLGHAGDLSMAERILSLAGGVIFLNAMLAVFNLIPIPPLDGSHILRHAVGMSELQYIKLAQWGGIVLLVLINIPFFQYLFGVMISAVASPLTLLMARLAGVPL